jgi:hypothetical protein
MACTFLLSLPREANAGAFQRLLHRVRLVPGHNDDSIRFRNSAGRADDVLHQW